MGLRPAQPAGPRSAPASSAPTEPETRARPWSRTDAAERFPGDTRGRSPAVARTVARAGRGAGPATKVTRGEDRGEELNGKSRLNLTSHLRCRLSKRQDLGAGPGPATPSLTRRQRSAEFPPGTGRDHMYGMQFSKYTLKV